MSTPDLDALVSRSYRHGFITDIDSDTVAPGLDEDVVRLISRKKGEPQFMLDWRLRALAHWRGMREPQRRSGNSGRRSKRFSLTRKNGK